MAARVKSARTERGLSQVELAEAAGVSPGNIGNLEAGTRTNPRELLAIAAALHVLPEWLKSGNGTRHVRPIEGRLDDQGFRPDIAQREGTVSPVAPAPTRISAATVLLARSLGESSPTIRSAAAPLLARLATHPEDAVEIGATLERLFAGSPSG